MRTSSDLGATLTRLTLSDMVQYAKRTLAGCALFFARDVPDFLEILQKIRLIFFANFA